MSLYIYKLGNFLFIWTLIQSVNKRCWFRDKPAGERFSSADFLSGEADGDLFLSGPADGTSSVGSFGFSKTPTSDWERLSKSGEKNIYCKKNPQSKTRKLTSSSFSSSSSSTLEEASLLAASRVATNPCSSPATFWPGIGGKPETSSRHSAFLKSSWKILLLVWKSSNLQVRMWHFPYWLKCEKDKRLKIIWVFGVKTFIASYAIKSMTWDF